MCVELVLALHEETHLHVTCDNRSSHSANLQPLLFQNEEEKTRSILHDPVAYGKHLYAALFPPNTLAHQTLTEMPERLLIVASDPLLDAIPWEYVYGPYGTNDPTSPDFSENFLMLECPFVRGLPTSQRVPPPSLTQSLHIVAIPSNPLSDAIEPLAIDAEWMRLKETIQELPYALTLERTTPPTMERVRSLVANQKGRVIHFMGHGGQDQQQGAVLCFEQDNGALHLVTAKEFVQRVRGTLFLVTLNACVSATPGPTSFSNLATALVRQKTPYALGMRLSILDEDARTFSRVFYQDLARGTSVEEALFQARLTLAQNPRSWVVGVPVLYTSLTEPAPGFVCSDGTPVVKENAFPVDVSVLPPVEGTFQGRIKDLLALGKDLTGDLRPRILTILGSGGQGKTALALKAVERFAFAWPGGVWAIALDTLPARSTFVIALAQFLGLGTQDTLDLRDIERQVLARLNLRRCLLVLDNAETVVEAVEAQNADALDLVAFLKKLLGTSACFLVTSRVPLGWDDEQTYELGGLSPEEGAALFRQGAPQRRGEIDLSVAAALSRQLEGHPLGLRLLAGTFNEISVSLPAFLLTTEERLQEAENKYVGSEHRHRKLYACIETSVRSLDPALRSLLSGLWIFHAPFHADTAVAIFDPETQETGQTASPVRDQLHQLYQRSLLTRRRFSVHNGIFQFYYLLPTTRLYIEHHLPSPYPREELHFLFGKAYAAIASFLYTHLDSSDMAIIIAQQEQVDLDRAILYLKDVHPAYYKIHWARALTRIDTPQRSLQLLEEALEDTQGHGQRLMSQVLNSMGLVYQAVGQWQRALNLFEQALSLDREADDHAGTAATLHNMALTYQTIGQLQRALYMYEQALSIREGDKRNTKAETLNSIGEIYSTLKQTERALELFEQALHITHEIGNLALEATVLSNLGKLYRVMGQPEHALDLYKQALPIIRKMGYRAGEATILHNMATAYEAIEQLEQVLGLYEQALLIRREISDLAGEAVTLTSIAKYLYRFRNNSSDAITTMKQAIAVLESADLPQNAGGETQEHLHRYLQRMQKGEPLFNTLPSDEMIEQFIYVVLTIEHERRDELRIAIEADFKNKQYEGPEYQVEVDFLVALLVLIDQRTLTLLPRHLYNPAIQKVAEVYRDLGQWEQALGFYDQVLPLTRQIGDRVLEATTLYNIASAYRILEQWDSALSFYEQALPLTRQIGNSALESSTLHNIGSICDKIGQLKRALSYYEQALPLIRRVGNRAGEILTLGNIAEVYRTLGQWEWALSCYEQALPITREVHNRAREALILHNMACMHQQIGQSEQALSLFEQALPIVREVSDRALEVAALHSMSATYYSIGQWEQALSLLEQVLPIMHEIGSYDKEASTLKNIARLLYHFKRTDEAITFMQQALELLKQTEQSQNIEGITQEQLLAALQIMHSGMPLLSFENAIDIAMTLQNKEGQENDTNNTDGGLTI